MKKTNIREKIYDIVEDGCDWEAKYIYEKADSIIKIFLDSLPKEFTLAEINQIMSYIEDRQREGWYYGNRKHFEKREINILNKLKERMGK
jgi:hypothetical protein